MWSVIGHSNAVIDDGESGGSYGEPLLGYVTGGRVPAETCVGAW